MLILPPQEEADELENATKQSQEANETPGE
jgi:hypothetical protein